MKNKCKIEKNRIGWFCNSLIVNQLPPPPSNMTHSHSTFYGTFQPFVAGVCRFACFKLSDLSGLSYTSENKRLNIN